MNKHGIKLDMSNIPAHVAIIMDGNGRWAERRGEARVKGHMAGAETFKNIAIRCKELGVKYFTVYAFSTENWKRPKDEVDLLMNMFRKYLSDSIGKMKDYDIALKVVGDINGLSPDIISLIEKADRISSTLDAKMVASLCINYGGRHEILHAVRCISDEVRAGRLGSSDITEEMLSSFLYTAGIPDPDLIIRPSGEIRISNFLLWQAAYTEYYFTDVLWPDFTPKHFDIAINEYQSRDRRFGGV